MKVDIFYKTYHKDFKLLSYSLQSLTKNVEGYNNIIILVPARERGLFSSIPLPERTIVHYVAEYGDGYLFQQWLKVSAHKYSDADYILFADSDCMFDHKINLQDFVSDGKPEILYTDWSKVGQAICWKECTETLMQEPVEWEFMRRNCLVYHRDTLINICNWQPNLEYIIMKSVRFSEFNLIGAYAYKNEREKYSFINTENWTYSEPKAIQLWSHHDKNGSDEHKTQYQRSLETINKVLDLNIVEI